MTDEAQIIIDETPKTAVRLKVTRRGAPPACLEIGAILCRGCPGWPAMKSALEAPDSFWTIIHCPATGLTLEREDG